jgi:hypothetical protein
MKIEIKNEDEKQELLRAIRLAERIALPSVADLSRIRDELTDMVF